MCQTNMEPKKSCLGTFHTTKVEISLSIFWKFDSCNFGTIFTFNLGPINAIFEALGVLESIWAQSSILQSTKNRIHRGSNLYVLFKNQGATRVATNLPPFGTKNKQSIFWTAYGKCTCKSKIILSTLYPLDTFRYDTLSLSMTISHLQIAVFLNSHPGSAFGRPVVMAGLSASHDHGWLGIFLVIPLRKKRQSNSYNIKRTKHQVIMIILCIRTKIVDSHYLRQCPPLVPTKKK